MGKKNEEKKKNPVNIMPRWGIRFARDKVFKMRPLWGLLIIALI